MAFTKTPDLQLSGTEYRKSEHTNRFRVAKSLEMHQLRSKSDKINRRTGPRKNTLSLWEKNFSNVPHADHDLTVQAWCSEVGCSGVNAFSMEQLLSEHWRAVLHILVFRNWAVWPRMPDDSRKTALIHEKQMDLCRDFDVFKASWLLRFDMYHWIGLYGLLDDQKMMFVLKT